MKKFLSMALTLVMTLSLWTFVVAPEASADFTDADQLSSQYAQQAADVIQTIEVMDGYDDGSFRPTAGLTRQAAAKIICNMILGPTTAKALPTNANPFPDVIAGNQFSGYISYCAQRGIISGYGDGTFRGGDPLSGYAYLKMLLGALGYSATQEGFVGDNWKVNVAKIALGIGLNKGIVEDLDGATQVTREAAAIYAFNTLQADMVEYDSKNTISVNGVEIAMGGGEATPQTWSASNTNANNINRRKDDGTNGNGYPIVQFAERYFDKLRRDPNDWDEYAADAFGRPSTKWFWKGVEIDTYPEDPDVSYNGNVSANTIYADLKMGSSDDAAKFYLNGVRMANIEISRGNGDDINKNNAAADRIGDGTIVEAYLNDAKNEVTVCAINVWGGKVTSRKNATSKKDECVVIDCGSVVDVDCPRGINDAGHSDRKEFETLDFDEDDVVGYTYSEADNEIKDMFILEPVEGALTRRYAGKSMVIDGENYKYAQNVVFDLPNRENDLTNKNEYIAYVDQNDLVLWVEESDFSVDQYALIDRIFIEMSDDNPFGTVHSSILRDGVGPNLAGESPSVNTPRARLLLPTGSLRTVTLNESKAYRETRNVAANEPDPNAATTVMQSSAAFGGNYETIKEDFCAGSVVRYSVNSDGEYKLQSVKAANSATYNGGGYASATGVFAIANNQLYGFVKDDATAARVTADSNTRFIINDGGTYKTYTGVRNVPEVYGATGNDVQAYAYCKGTLAKVVYIVLGDTKNSSKDITFLAAPSVSKLVEEDDPTPYYEYNAIVKNEITTVLVAAYKDGANEGDDQYLAAYASDGTRLWRVKAGSDAKDDCIILNDTEFDSDDVMTFGRFDGSGDVSVARYKGIKRVSGSTTEIKVYDWETDENGKNIKVEVTKDLSDNANIYYSNGDGEIEFIDVTDIRTDGDDYVYFTEDDGEITNLFIQENEDDDDDDDVEWGDGWFEEISDGRYVLHYLPADTARGIVSVVATNGRTVPNSEDVVDWVLTHLSYRYTYLRNSNGVYYFDMNGLEISVTLTPDATLDNNGDEIVAQQAQ